MDRSANVERIYWQVQSKKGKGFFIIQYKTIHVFIFMHNSKVRTIFHKSKNNQMWYGTLSITSLEFLPYLLNNQFWIKVQWEPFWTLLVQGPHILHQRIFSVSYQNRSRPFDCETSVSPEKRKKKKKIYWSLNCTPQT